MSDVGIRVGYPISRGTAAQRRSRCVFPCDPGEYRVGRDRIAGRWCCSRSSVRISLRTEHKKQKKNPTALRGCRLYRALAFAHLRAWTSWPRRFQPVSYGGRSLIGLAPLPPDD